MYRYADHVATRKRAIAEMGVHEIAILDHIESLLTAGVCFSSNPLLSTYYV